MPEAWPLCGIISEAFYRTLCSRPEVVRLGSSAVSGCLFFFGPQRKANCTNTRTLHTERENVYRNDSKDSIVMTISHGF